MTTKPVSNDTLLTQLRWRYATKQFDPTRKIPASDWRTLEESLWLTPSSFGLQPWRFIVVTDPATTMEGIDPARYDEILSLAAQGYQTVVVAAAGYRAAGDPYAQRGFK